MFSIQWMDDEMRSRVGARIRARRNALHLTQAELARRIPGVTESYVSRWERGENMPSWANLPRVAESLQTTVAWLLGETNGNGASEQP